MAELSNYISVALYSLDGTFRGYAILRQDDRKLQSTNVWLEGEEGKLNDQLERLNQNVDIRAFWPNAKDPGVVAILADENFMPIEYKMAQVVDDDHSYYVWKQVEEVDVYGNPTIGPDGRPVMVDSEHIDEEASVLAYKMAKVPVAPAHEMLRIKKACEVVARRRAGLLS